MHSATFWRWTFGLALLPAAGLVWLVHDPDFSLLSGLFGLVLAYAFCILLVGLLTLAWIGVADLARDVWSLIREVLGFRAGPDPLQR